MPDMPRYYAWLAICACWACLICSILFGVAAMLTEHWPALARVVSVWGWTSAAASTLGLIARAIMDHPGRG